MTTFATQLAARFWNDQHGFIVSARPNATFFIAGTDGIEFHGRVNLLKAGVPPWEVGRYAAWPAFMGTSKMIQPVGIVNACRPEMAARDARAAGADADGHGGSERRRGHGPLRGGRRGG